MRTVSKKRPKRRRTAGQRVGASREVLVHKAAELADAEGLTAISLARLAAICDIQTPTVSHHVGSLRQLRSDLALLAVEQLTEAVRAAGAGKRGKGAVRAMCRAYRAFVLTHPARFGASIETPDLKDARRLAAAGRLAGLLVEVFGQIGLQGDDAMRATRLLRAAVHGYATLELSAAWQTPLDDEATFDWLLEVIIAGLTAGSRPVI